MVEFHTSGLALAENCASEPGVVDNSDDRAEKVVESPSHSCLALKSGEFLFREGETKASLYRIEAGLICLTARRQSGPPRVVEIVSPGGFLGLGFLENHVFSAMAVVASRVSLFPLDALDGLCERWPEARDKQALATEREFAIRRRQLTRAVERSIAERVASFLSAVSHFNESEGREPNVVTASLRSGDVASFLGLDVDTLAVALTELQERGLIAPNSEGGLIILDLAGLEEMSSMSK